MKKIFIISVLTIAPHGSYAMDGASPLTRTILNLSISEMLIMLPRNYDSFTGLVTEPTINDVQKWAEKGPYYIKLRGRIDVASFGQPEEGTLGHALLEQTKSHQHSKVFGKWRTAQIDAHTQCRGDVSREIVCITKLRRDEFLAALKSWEQRNTQKNESE